ncbi:diaminopimelate decarboxylase [Flammeovirga kamogawensis]|uniref:Diaminopimelate decarboxylase n=1 Tax=Flammeovirga kamogawensis TaxID=373891 RepID=A0ABX8GW48_9BACT|nr:diaminopimelate decarboxylase [Flammeovirga kamogawensis]MBB6461203.1 diaminopimelate decarboxylase [Flammeovirga kamogawensis]QWG07766.1 diaminopimelate decarboxylase [Flammeovirga kamogawensis]TRX69572.1 diaminopimelate decarboxylase [Flammeovirga kamogawensis]
MELNNSEYSIQGVPVTDIANQFQTPVYVYDADKIVSQINLLRDSFNGVNLRIKYAMKSLSNLSILKLVKEHGVDLDAVSIQEVLLGLKAGFPAERILFTPNSVSFDEIQEAVALGVVINIDNIAILEQFGDTFQGSVPCAIRINPHITAGGNAKIQVGHIGSKFGVSIFQMSHVKKVVESHGINVVGLHMHSGSDILDSEVFLMAANVMFDCAKDFPNLQFIDLGSGFKVAYKEDDIVTNIPELGKKMSAAFQEFCKNYGRDLELWFEPGKFLVSESGHLLTKVNVLKHSPAAVFVGVDSGLNHLIRPMMYDAYHNIINISNASAPKRVYDVVGYICETDTFGYDRKLNEVRVGDILSLENAGAYSYSMSSNYNSRFRPAEVLVFNGKPHLIRERETLEDLTRGQVDIFANTPIVQEEVSTED